MDRRDFLSTAVCAAVLPHEAARAATGEDARLATTLDRLMAKQLDRNPELATQLGLDVGKAASLRRRLGEVSPRARREGYLAARRNRTALAGIDRTRLSARGRLDYDVAAYLLADAAEAARFSYGQGLGAPYALSQLNGAYFYLPAFLGYQHPIETLADAEAYLERLAALGTVLRGEIDLAREDVARGVVPPGFALAGALATLRRLADQPAAQADLVRSLQRRAQAAGLGGEWAARAEAIYVRHVQPAYAAQIAFLAALQKAPGGIGAWRLPDGEAYYAAALRRHTTTRLSPEALHARGREEVARLTTELDARLREVGLGSGAVGERLRALAARPDQLYPDTDAGKATLIADLNRLAEGALAACSRIVARTPKAGLEIRRAPRALEPSGPAGRYQPPSLDGTRPGIYWINLRNTAETPRFGLKTLTFHEGAPGHHLQASLAQETADIPLFRKVANFSAYEEGWALYAETLAVEMGLYQDDPFGRIGQLQAALLRAVRLVVDTGLHHGRWTREQAIEYLVTYLGNTLAAATTEVDRYAVWPGQACAYMAGAWAWAEARRAAERRAGPGFDLRTFHTVALARGSVPLELLEAAVGGA